MTEIDPRAEHAIHQAAANLARTRRHAVWLERIAVMVATFWIVTSTCVALGDPAASAASWALVVTLAVIGWAILRSLALVLHRHVDDVLVQLADDPAQPT